jgi:hypothetical protein
VTDKLLFFCIFSPELDSGLDVILPLAIGFFEGFWVRVSLNGKDLSVSW